MNLFVKFFTSLKLTVALLACAIVIVFIGTLAQADEGLYGAQAHYFKQWLIIGAHLFGHKIPLIFPGGYLVGTLLLVNLVCTHVYRFEFTFKKTGIQLAHAGIIVLLVGQLATDLLARELLMEFSEGESRNYSESSSQHELIFVNDSEVTAIPETMLKPGAEIKVASLPFTVRVKNYWRNSDADYRAPMVQHGPPLTTNGIGANFDFKPEKDDTSMNDQNIPTVVLEIVADAGPMGTWVAAEEALGSRVYNRYARQVGDPMGEKIARQLFTPQIIKAGGRQYALGLRKLRVQHPFSLTLLKATHTTYPGTDIPKDFRSRVLIDNRATGEKREVEISMNQPLRYGGYAYYQYQMNAGQLAAQAGRKPSSTLQVVRNPGWLTPYIGCTLVGVGLLIQFFYHLIGFITKRKPA